LGIEGADYRYSDDGEPSNSAGSPIYRQMLSADLTNVLIVVVRYYGGKKLGVGGLIEAYGECARLCLNDENIITAQVTRRIVFRTAFNQAYKAYQLASRMRWDHLEADPNDPERFSLEVIEDEYDEVITYMQDLPDFEVESY
jgi:putative IMPACT (imprinted ancient) family translation regulator